MSGCVQGGICEVARLFAEPECGRTLRSQNPQLPAGNTRALRLVATALIFPRLSCTVSVTVNGNQSWSRGRAGDGNRLQSVAGRDRTAPGVVCVNVADPENVQSQATMVPGADDVLPSNVHASAVPPLASEHVSLSVVPVTPKLASATVVRVTDNTAEAETPP